MSGASPCGRWLTSEGTQRVTLLHRMLPVRHDTDNSCARLPRRVAGLTPAFTRSFEWSYGWGKKFGLYGWDHGDPKFRRTLHETSKVRSLHAVSRMHTLRQAGSFLLSAIVNAAEERRTEPWLVASPTQCDIKTRLLNDLVLMATLKLY